MIINTSALTFYLKHWPGSSCTPPPPVTNPSSHHEPLFSSRSPPAPSSHEPLFSSRSPPAPVPLRMQTVYLKFHSDLCRRKALMSTMDFIAYSTSTPPRFFTCAQIQTLTLTLIGGCAPMLKFQTLTLTLPPNPNHYWRPLLESLYLRSNPKCEPKS